MKFPFFTTKKLRRLAVVYSALLVPILAMVLAGYWRDTPFEKFSRDPAGSLKFHPFLGALSNVGILLWSATTFVCLFTAALLCRPFSQRSCEANLFILFGGLSAMLLVDDFFLVHEELFPNYLHLSEKVLYLFYVAAAAFCFWSSREPLLRARPGLLVSALCFFAASLGLDFFSESFASVHYLLEDGFKFLGIGGWCAFFVGHAFAILSARMEPTMVRPGIPPVVPELLFNRDQKGSGTYPMDQRS